MTEKIEQKCFFCNYYEEKSCFPSHGKCFHPKNNPDRQNVALKRVGGNNSCEFWELQKKETKLNILLDEDKRKFFGY